MTATVSISSGLWVALGFGICALFIALLARVESRRPPTKQEQRIEEDLSEYEKAQSIRVIGGSAGPDAPRVHPAGRDRAA